MSKWKYNEILICVAQSSLTFICNIDTNEICWYVQRLMYNMYLDSVVVQHLDWCLSVGKMKIECVNEWCMNDEWMKINGINL